MSPPVNAEARTHSFVNNSTYYSVKLDEELGLEASAGVVLALPPLTQQTVHFI